MFKLFAHRVGNANPPPGFTLLEVILALGILAAALAVIGEVTRLSHGNAERAAMEGDALLIAESVMSQLTAGLIDPTNITGMSWQEPQTTASPQPPTWQYSLSIEQTELEDLLAARVSVQQIVDADDKPISVQLVRWIVDPDAISASDSSGGIE